MKKQIWTAAVAAGVMALGGCSGGTRALPENYQSMSDSEKKVAMREFTDGLTDGLVMEFVNNMYVNLPLEAHIVRNSLSTFRENKICRSALSECSEASNLSQCMKIKHPGWEFSAIMGNCSRPY